MSVERRLPERKPEEVLLRAAVTVCEERHGTHAAETGEPCADCRGAATAAVEAAWEVWDEDADRTERAWDTIESLLREALERGCLPPGLAERAKEALA